jgi:hypothetical protein
MTDTALTTIAAPKQVASLMGGTVSAIVPQTFEDVYRIAQVVSQSGLCPHGMDTPQKVTVAILTGLEIGVKPMQAIQGIAVIGGRPCVWGDLALGVVRGSGELEWIREEFIGDEDAVDWTAAKPDGDALKFKARCTVKRKGQPETVNEFSIADAVLAKLWGKRGYNGKDTPWITNPKRMLKMRARGFSLRDQFTDVLKGLYIAEELIGVDMEDRTPQVTGPAAPIPQAAVAGPSAPQPAESPKPEPEEAELVETPSPAAGEAQPAPAPSPEPEKPAEVEHPAHAQEEPFDVEAWLEEAQGLYHAAKTLSDVDDVHAIFEDTASDLPSIERQRYEDMHGAAIERIEDAARQAAEAQQDAVNTGEYRVRYFIHPESGAAWMTHDGSAVSPDSPVTDGLVEEVDAKQFETFTATMEARGALKGDFSEAQDDDVTLEADDDEQVEASGPSAGEIYVAKIRAMIADPALTFPVVGKFWNDTKADRSEMMANGLISKETRNELLAELDTRKKAEAPAPQEDGPGAPPSEAPAAPPPPANDQAGEDAMTKLDRKFRADLEACTDKVAVAALSAETLVARNKFSGTPQHKVWQDLISAKRKSFAGVTA